MHFEIDVEFTKILGQCKPKKNVNLFMTCNFKFFSSLNWISINFNYYFLNTLLNKFQDYFFICSIWVILKNKTYYKILIFLNNFMPNTINLNIIFFVNKVLKWFGG
jgi:hypothetical protein